MVLILHCPASPEAASQSVALAGKPPRVRLPRCAAQVVASAIAPGMSPAIYRAPGQVVAVAGLGQGDRDQPVEQDSQEQEA